MYTVTSTDYRNVFPRTIGTYEESLIAIGMAIVSSIADSKHGFSGTALITDTHGIAVACYMNGKKIYSHIGKEA